MRIAPHLIKGTPESRLHNALGCYVEYTPVCPWPDDCLVQWGHGIVPANPFFEAFPPGTFIRGDGESIESAERKAFAQYRSEVGCDHLWGRHAGMRGTYLNGAGWCRRCGAFRSNMFPAVVQLGSHRKPLARLEADYLRLLEEDLEMNAHMDRLYPERAADRLRSQRMLRLRLNLFGQDSHDPTPECGQ